MGNRLDRPHWLLADVRDVPVAELEELLTRTLAAPDLEACLWTSCRPRKNWFRELTSFHPLVLASSAKFEQILWLAPGAVSPVPEEWADGCGRLLNGYRGLFSGECVNDYSDAVKQHITQNETEIFPELLSHLPDLQRSLRELSYEHRGLENGLKRMPSIVEQWQNGVLDPKARERFDLDFFHLLEHNIERKLNAIYPALAYFQRNLG